MSSPVPVTLTVPSDLQLLPVVRGFIASVCQVGGLDAKTTDAIVLATNEATSNVIRHAHRDRPQALIHVQCTLLADGIEVRLFDEGEPFNVQDVPHLDPAELRVGGRGVFLMRALLDELVCCPRADGGNTLRMVKRCPAAPTNPETA
jgi:serine/threonine-protein kinase RsbW